ncbi:hypothetical protein [Ekhidna sp.]
MKYSIIKSEPIFSDETMLDFIEAIRNREFLYRASSLMETDEQFDQMVEAVNRAMKACLLRKIPIHDHFQGIYLTNAKTHETIQDWKLSRLGYVLVILNGDPRNQLVAKTQIELAKSLL